MPLPRFSLSAEDIARPVPSLTERQYIVDKSGRSTQQVAAEKELFWYREKLLGMLSLTWSDVSLPFLLPCTMTDMPQPSSQRSGQVSLRQLYLPPSLLGILRTERVEITLSVSDSSVTAMEFFSLSCRIHNKLDRPFRPSVNIVPLPSSAVDSSWAAPASSASANKRLSNVPAAGRNVAFDGVLTHVLPALPPGDAAEHTLGVCFLASGKYAFRAAVEEIDINTPPGAHSPPPEIWFSDILQVAASA